MNLKIIFDHILRILNRVLEITKHDILIKLESKTKKNNEKINTFDSIGEKELLEIYEDYDDNTIKVCFAVCNGLGCFKYFGPIIEIIKDEKNIAIFLCVTQAGSKYYGLLHKKNYEKFKNIVSSLNPAKLIPLTKTKIKCDILFTINCLDSDKFDYKKHYAILHGFDEIKNYDSKTIFLCSSEEYGLDLRSRYNVEFLVAPLPVAFSNINRQIEFARKKIKSNKDIAFIFFPYKENVRLTRSIIKKLKKNNFFVIIKQRKKDQRVPKKIGADLIIYDELWYPSEAVFYPLVSKIVIGFDTSAYVDLTKVGVPYIDNAIFGGVNMFNSIKAIKPNFKNFWSFDKKFVKNTKRIIDQICSKNFNYEIKIIKEDLIQDFYLELLKN